MTRSSLGLGLLGVAALTLSPLALVGPAQATTQATTRAGSHVARSTPPSGTRHVVTVRDAAPGSPDPSFGPARRRDAIAHLQRVSGRTADDLGLGARQGLVVRDVLLDRDGTRHVRYDRTYAGLPVVGGDLVVEDPTTGPSTATLASNAPIVVPTTTPGLSADRAAETAAARPGLRAGSTAVKVVYAAQHRPVLAWRTTVHGRRKDGTPIRDLVYTDATTGRQLARVPQIMESTGSGRGLYTGRVNFQTTRKGSLYELVDAKRGGAATYTMNNGRGTRRGTLVTDRNDYWGDGTTANPQSAAVDAAYGATQTWAFYRTHFGRVGINDNGRAAYSRVHFGTGYQNAFWDGDCFCMTYGDGGADFRPLTSLDIAGHEMTHGVTAHTADLDYTGESGGLNESTSDVMGTMVEFEAANSSEPGNYYIGENVAKHRGWLRRMDNPSLDGTSVNCWSPSVNDLDPHYSSGVGNHLFYLLAEGTGTKTIGGLRHSATSCDGSTLSGIGRDAASALWYRALTTYWTSTTDYARAANAMIKAAKDIYPRHPGVCTSTLAAWRAVDVSPTETCAVAAPDPANLVGNPGFEGGRSAWSASRGVIIDDPQVARTGAGYAYLDGYGEEHVDTVAQTITIPEAGAVTLDLYLLVDTDESTAAPSDYLRVWVTPSGAGASRVAYYSNVDESAGYEHHTIDLSAFAGQQVTLSFIGTEGASLQTGFVLDDLSLTAS